MPARRKSRKASGDSARPFADGPASRSSRRARWEHSPPGERRAGLTKGVNADTFRHHFAANWLESGMQLMRSRPLAHPSGASRCARIPVSVSQTEIVGPCRTSSGTGMWRRLRSIRTSCRNPDWACGGRWMTKRGDSAKRQRRRGSAGEPRVLTVAAKGGERPPTAGWRTAASRAVASDRYAEDGHTPGSDHGGDWVGGEGKGA